MRVLIVKTSALGDIVQAFPVVEYLKRVQKVDRVGWVAEEQAVELLSSHPLIDDVIPISSKAITEKFPSYSFLSECRRQRKAIRNKQWDVLFDLQTNCKSACATFFSSSSKKVGFGFKTAPEKVASLVLGTRINPPIDEPMRQQYLTIVQRYFQDARPFEPQPIVLQLNQEQKARYLQEVNRWPTDRPIWIVSLGSKWYNKVCDPEKMAEALASLQKEWGIYYVFTAATTQELNEAGTCLKKLPHTLAGNVLYQVSLPVVQHLLAYAKRFIGVDSLMLHLASTTRTPTFSLFGPSSASIYAPGNVWDASLQGICPYGTEFVKRCPTIRTCPSGSCIKQIKAKQIESAIRGWLEIDLPVCSMNLYEEQKRIEEK